MSSAADIDRHATLFSDFTFPVPVRPDSALRLQLLLKEPRLDLEAMAATVASDPGLRMTIERFARRGFDDSGYAPITLTDCIIEVGREQLMALVQVLPIWKKTNGSGRLPGRMQGLRSE